MKYLVILLFAAVATADYKDRKDYGNSHTNIKNGFQKVMEIIKYAETDTNNAPTNYAMLLSAVLSLGVKFKTNPSLYEKDFLETSVNAMNVVVHDVPAYKHLIKEQYHNTTVEHISIIKGLEKKLCKLDVLTCDDKIDEYYAKEVPKLPEDDKKKTVLARSVLFSLSDAIDALLEPVAPQIDLLQVANVPQPALSFLEKPKDVLALVDIVSNAIFYIQGGLPTVV